MPFSFNPGQEQPTATVAQSNNGVPALVVPDAPTISLTPIAEKVSPFAFRNRSKSKFGIYFQSVIFLIFGVIFIASFGLFAYQSTLKIQIASKKSELDSLQAGFKMDKTRLEDMQKLSSRLSLINKIMNERASVRTAFAIVEESIASDAVTYNKFSLSKSKKDNNYDLSFAGDTNSYNSLYQQVAILNSKQFAGVFPKLSIGGIGPIDKKGITSFKVDASVAISGVDPDTFNLIYKDDNGSTTPITASSSDLSGVINQNSSSTNVAQ